MLKSGGNRHSFFVSYAFIVMFDNRAFSQSVSLADLLTILAVLLGKKQKLSPKGEALSKPEVMEEKEECARMAYFCHVV
jgi:hypothetical protein